MEGENAKDAVERWLRESGTPLELRTASSFRRGGAFDVEHARYYIDVVTDELRETDVVATFVSRSGYSFDSRPWFTLRFVVECKRAGRPWVAFLADDILARKSTEQLATFESKVFGLDDAPQITAVFDAPLVASLERHAYQLVDTGTSQDAHKAVRQVMSAARGIARDIAHTDRPSAVYVVPVIVTAGPLFTCKTDANGDPELAEVDRILLVSRLVADDTLRSVWIVRDTAVDAFVADAQQSAGQPLSRAAPRQADVDLAGAVPRTAELPTSAQRPVDDHVVLDRQIVGGRHADRLALGEASQHLAPTSVGLGCDPAVMHDVVSEVAEVAEHVAEHVVDRQPSGSGETGAVIQLPPCEGGHDPLLSKERLDAATTGGLRDQLRLTNSAMRTRCLWRARTDADQRVGVLGHRGPRRDLVHPPTEPAQG